MKRTLTLILVGAIALVSQAEQVRVHKIKKRGVTTRRVIVADRFTVQEAANPNPFIVTVPDETTDNDAPAFLGLRSFYAPLTGSYTFTGTPGQAWLLVVSPELLAWNPRFATNSTMITEHSALEVNVRGPFWLVVRKL